LDRSEFHAPGAGRVVTTPDGYAAFVPAPLPPRLTFTRELALALSRADAALGELSGVGGELPDPQLLDASFQRQEALCSSRIEGAEVTLSDLLLDQVSAARPGVPREHLREVRDTVATLRYGVARLEETPLSLELVRELHERLLRGEVGDSRTPGEFRTSQNWIGPPGATLATATYVPPPVPEMMRALEDFGAFLEEHGRLPDLVQCAMLHEQFEAIHPFAGGNGRLGRLLVTLFLIDRGRLARPLLYLSAYLEAHRDEYYTLLQRVRTHGEWLPWLVFFANGVRETAERATKQARALIRLHDRISSKVKGRELTLALELFRTPCMTTPEARRVLGVSKARARRAIAELELRSLLVEYSQPRKPRVLLAKPVLEAVLHPLEELRRSSSAASAGTLIKSGPPPGGAPVRRADRLMREAMAIVDSAREHGAQLRLVGGLAVRRYCVDLDFIDREYSDIDFVGLSQQAKELSAAFAGLGYVENRYVSQATDSGQMQFIKAEALRAASARAAAAGAAAATGTRPGEPSLVDHVDIFLDVMRMDHDIDIGERLDIDEYAVSPVDALIAKLQIGRINQKDVHDVIALLKDLPAHEVEEDVSLDVAYFAEVCARDWGLYQDIRENLGVVFERLDDYGLSEEQLARVRGRLETLIAVIEEKAKSLRWRLRATVGKRVAWRREIEDTEGGTIIAPEWDWRRDLG
jgi:cell filamentation protein, protein adenylyltransferase